MRIGDDIKPAIAPGPLELDGEVWDLVEWVPGRLRVYRSRQSGALLVYRLD